MLTADMLTSDDEYKEICEDIQQECETSGAVTELKVVRTGPLAGVCFVKFGQLSGAAKARESLDKRQFDGNTVQAIFVSEADMEDIVTDA